MRWENARQDPDLGVSGRVRTAAGLLRRARPVRQMIEQTAGLQSNGPDTAATYGRWSPNPLTFYDTRVTETDRAGAQAVTVSGPLTLAFSGRWIAQKGVLDAIETFTQVRAQVPDTRLLVCGGGPLAPQVEALARRAGPGVEVLGTLAFHPDWVRTVTERVHLMVLPHRQADSASTFLEAMSCGAPTVAYRTRYSSAFHAEHGAGSVVDSHDPAALAAEVVRLAGHPGAFAASRSAGLEWAREHTFEREFARRVEHLRDVAQV